MINVASVQYALCLAGTTHFLVSSYFDRTKANNKNMKSDLPPARFLEKALTLNCKSILFSLTDYHQ